MYNRQNQRRDFGSVGHRRDQHQNRSGIASNSIANTPSPWLSSGFDSSILSNSPVSLVDDPQTRLALARNLLNDILTVHNQQQPAPLLGLGNFALGRDQYNAGGPSSLYTRNRYSSGSAGSEGRYTGVTTGVTSRYTYQNKNNRDNKGKQFDGAQPRKAANARSQNKFPPKKTKSDVKQAQATKCNADNTKTNEFKDNVRKNGSKNAASTVKQEEADRQTTSNTTESSVKVEKMEVDDSEQKQSNVEVVVDTESEKGTDESKEIEKNEGRKKEIVQKKSRYTGIPVALLYCHVCEKHMWDYVSFEKHLEGRIHKMMMEELDKTYKLKVDFLRHNSHVKEKQKEYELIRNSRRKPNKKTGTKGYCTMCKLHFIGTLPVHRKDEKHQNLKRFIHPKCSLCEKEFYTRLEWDEHKLTSDHLTKLGEYRRKTKPYLKDEEHNIVDLLDELQSNDLTLGETTEDIKVETENQTEDLTTFEIITDKKNADRPHSMDEIIAQTGQYLVEEATGFLCRACNRFLPTKEDKKIHLFSSLHRNSLSNLLHLQSKITQKRKASMSNSEKVESPSHKANDVDKKRVKLNESMDVDEEDNDKKNEAQDIEGTGEEKEKTVVVKDLIILLENTVSEIQDKMKEEEEETGNIDNVGSQDDNENAEIDGINEEIIIETKVEQSKDETKDICDNGETMEDKTEKEEADQKEERKVNIPPQKARRGKKPCY